MPSHNQQVQLYLAISHRDYAKIDELIASGSDPLGFVHKKNGKNASLFLHIINSEDTIILAKAFKYAKDHRIVIDFGLTGSAFNEKFPTALLQNLSDCTLEQLKLIRKYCNDTHQDTEELLNKPVYFSALGADTQESFHLRLAAKVEKRVIFSNLTFTGMDPSTVAGMKRASEISKDVTKWLHSSMNASPVASWSSVVDLAVEGHCLTLPELFKMGLDPDELAIHYEKLKQWSIDPGKLELLKSLILFNFFGKQDRFRGAATYISEDGSVKEVQLGFPETGDCERDESGRACVYVVMSNHRGNFPRVFRLHFDYSEAYQVCVDEIARRQKINFEAARANLGVHHLAKVQQKTEERVDDVATRQRRHSSAIHAVEQKQEQTELVLNTVPSVMFDQVVAQLKPYQYALDFFCVVKQGMEIELRSLLLGTGKRVAVKATTDAAKMAMIGTSILEVLGAESPIPGLALAAAAATQVRQQMTQAFAMTQAHGAARATREHDISRICILAAVAILWDTWIKNPGLVNENVAEKKFLPQVRNDINALHRVHPQTCGQLIGFLCQHSFELNLKTAALRGPGRGSSGSSSPALSGSGSSSGAEYPATANKLVKFDRRTAEESARRADRLQHITTGKKPKKSWVSKLFGL